MRFGIRLRVIETYAILPSRPHFVFERVFQFALETMCPSAIGIMGSSRNLFATTMRVGRADSRRPMPF